MGFPDRPARIGFGPEMQNKYPPVIPETDLSADQMNLTFWQVAGAGRTLPLAVLLFDGATPSILFQMLAMDPKQELGDLAFVKNAVGDYTFTFAGTYKDERGADRPFVPQAAMTMLQGSPVGSQSNVYEVTGQTVQVRVRDIANVLEDGTFILAVW